MTARRSFGPALLLGLAACAAAPPPSTVLDWTLGEWRGTRSSGGEPETAPAERRDLQVTVTRTAGGAHVERLQVALDDGAYVGVAVRTPLGDGDRWEVLYANDARARIARLEGRRDGDTLTVATADRSAARQTRMVWRRRGDDGWLRTQRLSEDGGRSWRVLFCDELRRVTATGTNPASSAVRSSR
ncbi:MAG: hypothetical protein AB7O97_20570 [Planctomycetota bacterium]